MFKKKVLLVAFCAVILFAGQAFCAETTNSVGLGVRGGISFTGGEWDANIFNMSPVLFVPVIQGGEINFGIHPNFSIGLLGYWGRTEGLPALYTDPDLEDFKITHYIGELVGNVYFSPENEWRPYFTAGIGLTSWRVTDQDGERIKIEDLNGEPFSFNDQQMTLMFGAGIEYFLNDRFSVGAAARYHLFTSVMSQFEDDRDVADKYDVPSGLFEFGLTMTGYFTSCEDDDKDGVCNEDDLCPETPPGCIIDEETGCELDGDGDGVCDGLDQCPDTPKDCKVDAAGCHMDSDGDGVCDGIDRCEKTPKDCPIDAYGCPLDTDEDGVWDCLDNCKSTRTGCRVDANGCAIDGDKDGVCDGIDQCPGTPEGLQVDEAGCPRAYKIEKELVLVGVTFASSQATLTGGSPQELDKVVESLKALPHVKLEIQGHTDSQGARAFNTTLSENRAKAVMDYFISQGVSPDRLTARGYGPDKPIGDNNTAAGRAQNRRVELKRLN